MPDRSSALIESIRQMRLLVSGSIDQSPLWLVTVGYAPPLSLVQRKISNLNRSVQPHSRHRNGDDHILQIHVLGLELVLDVDVADTVAAGRRPAVDWTRNAMISPRIPPSTAPGHPLFSGTKPSSLVDSRHLSTPRP